MRKTFPTSDQPAVSVIIPTCNRPVLLNQAVSSLLRQSRPAYQIIIVNDGSQPSCQPQLESIADRHPSISLLEMGEKRGAGAARNAGLAEADGDFVVFLDDDDLLHHRALEINSDFLAAHPGSDIVVCKSRMFLSLPITHSPPSWFWLTDQVSGRRLKENPLREILRFPVPINAVLFRKSCLGSTPFRSDLRMGEERFLLLSLAARGCRFAFQPLPLAFIRIHLDSVQAGPDASRESVRFLQAVLNSDLPLRRHDRFLCHARLILLHLRLGDSRFWSHLWPTLRSPHLSFLYGVWYLIIQARKRSRYRALLETELPELTGIATT